LQVGQGTLAINDLWEAGAKGYALDRLVPIYGVEKPSALAVAPAGGVVDPGAVQLGTLRVVRSRMPFELYNVKAILSHFDLQLVRLAPLATGMTQHGMVTGSAATAASEAATMSNNPNIGGSGMGGARNSFTGGTGTGIGTGIGNTGYGQGGAGYGGTGTGAGLGAVAAGASGAGMGAGTYTPTGTTSLPMSQQGGYTGQPQQQMMGQNYSQTPKQQQPGPMYNTGMPQQQGQQQMGGYQQQGGLPTGAMEPLNTGSGSGVGTGTGGWPQQQQQGATGVHTPMHHTPMAQGQQQQPMMQQQQQPAQYGSQGQLNPSGVKTPMAYEQQAAGMQQYSQQSQLGQQQGYVGPAAGSDPQSHQTFAGQQGHAMNQPGIANPY
jgi:hypothetical protein